MRKVLFCASITLFILAGSAAAPIADKKIISLEGDAWPPYVMDPAGGKNGFIVDAASAVFAEYGYEVKYTNTPWTRALQDTERGKTDGAAGIYFSEARERKLIVPEEEIGISINKIYVKKNSTWTYTGIQSLKSITLGIIDSYDYGELNRYLSAERQSNSGKVEVMFGDKALENNIRKLTFGRIDAVIEDEIVFILVASQMGVKDQIKEAGTAKPFNKVGIAFSPKNPNAAEYARILSAGIIKLRASGELKQILDKYGVKDWK